MEIMLYIIAGLAIVLIVAVFMMRKNKAQKPPVQSSIQDVRRQVSSAPVPESPTSNVRTEPVDKKFDHLTIAQRFIDQQRYDKAVETLNRGLVEKPNDSQLSIKLLSVYAATNQINDFDNLYSDIKAHDDADTVVQADELKSLLAQEQEQTQAHIKADNAQADDYNSLDFDLPAQQDDTFDTVAADETSIRGSQSPVTPQTNETLSLDDLDSSDGLTSFNDEATSSDNFDNSFDLTLDDLENVDDSENAYDSENVNDVRDISETDTNNDFDDFDLSVDFSDADNSLDSNDIQSADTPVVSLKNDNSDSLLTEDLSAHQDTSVTNIAPVSQPIIVEDTLTVTDDTLTDDAVTDDFDLDFELPEEDETPSRSETLTDNEANTFDVDEFDLDFSDTDTQLATESDTQNVDTNGDADFALSLSDIDTADDATSLEPATDETPSDDSSETNTAPVLFDDNTELDDELNTASSPIVDAPVDSGVVDASDITATSAASAEDFSARFAEDFDFVKSLDSNQVTLDLAAQYLQLGEYDSAKRLLNEVITQGNSEQQTQAQILLERTA